MTSNDDQLLTRMEVAQRLHLSVKTVDRAIRRGWLRKVDTGCRSVRVALSEVVRFMNRSQVSRV